MAAHVLTTQQLLQLDPDQLLSTHSLSDCVQVGQQLGREVDKKREELRVMVGERYRDLIEAADTIQNMKISAGKVIQSVEGMQASCGHLQQQAALSCLTSKGEAVKSRESPNTPYLAVAASVKLLLAVPERIWAAVEAEQLAVGAQLFLLAQHVHTGLQGDAGGGLTAEKVAAWFPVISRQWANIQSLNISLITCARQALSTPKLTVDVAADCLLTLLLLSNCGIDELFSEYLSLRQDSVSSVLLTGRTDAARMALSSLLHTVLHTLGVAHSLFLKGDLHKKIEYLLRRGPSLSLLPQHTLAHMQSWLPGPVQSFQPRLENRLVQLEVDEVQNGLLKWVQQVGQGARSEAKSLLQYVDSVQGVSGVRDGLECALNNHSDWRSFILPVLGQSFCLWDFFYRQVLTDRVLELVKFRLNEVIDGVLNDFKVVLNDWEKWQGRDWVWQESSQDINKGRGKIHGGLGLKCTGWDPTLQEVLGNLELGLEKVCGGVQDYCMEERGDKDEHLMGNEFSINNNNLTFDKYVDSDIIRNDVGKQIGVSMAHFIKDCKIHTETLVEDSSCLVMLILGRMFQATVSLCPSLKAAFGQDTSSLSDTKKLLDTESELCFSLWVESRLTEFSSSLPYLSSSIPLTLFPTWDRVTIEETADSGEQVSSVILIPPSPSLPLHSSLLKLSASIHSSNPSSFPSSVLSSATMKLLHILLNHYTSIASQRIAQNLALQLSFDLRFLQTLLVSRDCKDSVADKFSSLLEQLEANIDPFDLSVFSPHLLSRVRWAAARSVSGLGCLVSSDRVPLVTSHRAPSSAVSGQDGHNVLHIHSGAAPRFQLFPLTSTSIKTSSMSVSAGGVNLSVNEPKKTAATRRTRDRSPVAQTAASFFGSMSQSWFGGSNTS